jgi:predicted amidohydrolase YtcJ
MPLTLTRVHLLGRPDLMAVTIEDGVVTAVGPDAAVARTGECVDADGRWLLPGFWDEHVHFRLWAEVSRRLDVSTTTSAAAAARLVGAEVANGTTTVIAAGFRDALWPDAPHRDLLDAATGAAEAYLISADLHSIWLNSAALRRFDLADHPTGLLREADCFRVTWSLSDVPEPVQDTWVAEAAARAASRGVTGVVDLDLISSLDAWRRRAATGFNHLRVNCGVFADALDQAIKEGLRTGGPLLGDAPTAVRIPSQMVRNGPSYAHQGAVHVPRETVRKGPSYAPQGVAYSPSETVRNGPSYAQGPQLTEPAPGCTHPDDIFTVGPLKIIADGSLNTRTAWCFDPYPGLTGPDAYGLSSYPLPDLIDLLRRGWSHGLVPAVHAIGDRANAEVLDAFAAVGCPGRIEHAQLLRWSDIQRLADLGLTASVQPQHTVDDRDVADHHWPGRTDRAYAFRSLLDAGATLALGSDAPVAPLDPWVTIAAAVARTGDTRPPWHREQALPITAALAASARGRTTITPGQVADLQLVDRDPLTTPAADLRTMPVAATWVAGRPTHLAL